MTITAQKKKPLTAEQKRLLFLKNRLIRATRQCEDVAGVLKSVSSVLSEMAEWLGTKERT